MTPKWLFLVALVGALPTAAGSAPAPPIDASLGNVIPVVDQSSATGPIARFIGGVVQSQIVTIAITDTLDPLNPSGAPRDTVPRQARIDFSWHAEPTAPGANVVAYRYDIGGGFTSVDSSVHSASFNTGGLDVLSPGVKTFTLVAVDELGGERQITRRFMLDFAPDAWFAGPDPAAYPIVPGSGGQRYLDVASWTTPPPLPASLLSCDSLTLRPAARIPRKTFFEIYGNRIYLRAENDTIDRNSWVVLGNGGSDLDSPYLVKVFPGDPTLQDTVDCAAAGTPWTVRPAGLNGSPIGFRYQVLMTLDPGPIYSVAPASSLYPNFDPGSVFWNPTISGYWTSSLSGKVYLDTWVTDGDEVTNRFFPSMTAARDLADSVDLGLATSPASLAKREKILTFFVNRNPFFNYGNPAFRPKPPEFNGGAIDTYLDRVLQLNLIATDPDPYDLANPPSGPGGPSSTAPLTYTVTVTGKNLAGNDTSYTAPTSPVPNFSIDLATVAPWIVSTDLTLDVRLCDCVSCDLNPGSGRCVVYSIPVRVSPSVGTLASLISAEATPTEARVRWAISGEGPARVERRTAESAWQWMSELMPDGSGRVTFEDRAVVAGTRYGYRVSLQRQGQWVVADQAWVEVPRTFALALEGVRPNPAVGDLTLGFSLPDDRPASVEIFDTSGRRVWSQRTAPGAGRRLVALGNRFAPGVYVVRLSHEGRALSAKFTVVR